MVMAYQEAQCNRCTQTAKGTKKAALPTISVLESVWHNCKRIFSTKKSRPRVRTLHTQENSADQMKSDPE